MPRPWWETLEEGPEVRLAFLCVDLVGSTRAREEDRRAFQGIVQESVLAFGGTLLEWHGDGNMAFFYTEDGLPEPPALRAAQRIAERVRSEHGLAAHLGIHSGVVPFRRRLGADLFGRPVNQAGHLGKVAPPQVTLISAEAAEGLPDDLREALGYFGTTRTDRVPCLAWPKSHGMKAGSTDFLPPGKDLWAIRTRYLDRLRTTTRYIRLVGPRQIQKSPTFDITSIFVPPELVRVESGHRLDLLDERMFEPDSDRQAWARARTPRPPERVSLAHALARHRALALVGDPGAGKTTVLRWLAHVSASGRRAAQENLHAVAGLLPILVPAGALRGLVRGRGTLGLALQKHWETEDVPGTRRLFEEAFARGSALLLVDGLDELSEASDRIGVSRLLARFAADHAQVRVVVTSRRIGYEALVLGAWEPFEVPPFGAVQVERLVRRWFVEYERLQTPEDEGSAHRGEEQAARFLRALEAGAGLRDLLRNPFLLAIACLVHRQGVSLPRYRVELYDLIAQTLIETWGKVRGMSARPVERAERDYRREAVSVLQPLARHLHEHVPSGVLPEEEIEAFLVARLAEGGVSQREARRSARAFLEELRTTTHLLVERGPDRWGFMHLSFQEFFTARDVIATERIDDEIAPHVYDPRWREVIRLVAGILGLLPPRPRAVASLVERVLRAEDPVRGRILRRNLWLAADCLNDAGGGDPVRVKALGGELAELAVRGEFPILQRNAARALGALHEVGGATVIDPLLAFCANDDPREREAAARALGSLGSSDPRVQDALLGRLDDQDGFVRAVAAQALGSLGSSDPRVQDGLLARLGDESPLVCAAAEVALGSLGSSDPRAPDALLARLDDKERYARVEAASALISTGSSDPRAPDALLARLDDRDRYTRVEAASALGSLGSSDPRIQDTLLGSLNDEVVYVRAAAARALGSLGSSDPRVQDALLGNLHDKHSYVREAAAEALDKLADAKPPAPDPA